MSSLNPSASRLEQIKAKLDHAQTSSDCGEEAKRWLEQLSTIWAIAPDTATQRRARKSTYDSAVGFLYDHDLM